MKTLLHYRGQGTNVVFRLRMTFLFIVTMLIISTVLGGYLLHNLQDSQQHAIENSVPILAESQELESHLANISDLTVRLSNENKKQSVITLRDLLVNQMNELVSFIDTTSLISNINDESVIELKESLRFLERSVSELVPSKLNMIYLNDLIASRLAEVTQIRTSFTNLLEPLSLELASSLNTSLNSMSVTQKPFVVSQSSILKRKFNDQYQLLELSYRMSALLDDIEHLSPTNSENTNDEIKLRVNLGISSLTRILINFDDNSSRQKLAIMIKSLRNLTVGADGLLNDIDSHNDYQSNYNTALSEQRRLVNDASSAIDSIVVVTKQEIQHTTLIFDRVLNQIVAVLALVGFIVIGTIVVVNICVVENQINLRMLQLTTAVTDIANGDTNRKVNVSGSDEIGTIAGALEVFKTNAKELQRSNNELEQFAYAASHDLKSPLRAIENLAQWTIEDAGDTLSTDSKSNLKQLLSRARRLSRLQSDLLEYSRAGKADNSNDILDFNRVISELQDLIDPEHHFTMNVNTFEDELRVQITPLYQILLNLVTNAIKHHDQTKGEIEISAHVENGRLRVSVSDDGPGILPEYHERIFGLFEKLESQDTVEGSGLGLSLVRKVIDQHNGIISVQSNPTKQRGTTFTFDWPIIEFLAERRKVVGL